MADDNSLFGRAAKFVQEKARDAQDALERRALVRDLSELSGYRHHYETLLPDYGLDLRDRDQLPDADVITGLNLDRLREIGRGKAAEMLGLVRAKEAVLNDVLGQIDWAHGHLYQLRTLHRDLSVSLDKAGITRAHLRPAIGRVTDAARNRGGAIGGGNAAGVLMSIETETLRVPVARIPEEKRRYLTAALYLAKFQNNREAVRLRLSSQMLVTIVDHGGLDNISNNLQHEVLSASLPSLLRTYRSELDADLIRVRQYAAEDNPFAGEIAEILAGGEPRYADYPDVPGLNPWLPDERINKMNADMAANIRGELVEEPPPVLLAAPESEPPVLSEADAEAIVRRARTQIFEPGDAVLFAPVRAYVEIASGISNVEADMRVHALGRAQLAAEAPLNASFETAQADRLRREVITAGAEDFARADGRRKISGLTQSEKVALFATTVLHELGDLTQSDYLAHVSLLAWGNGKGDLIPSEGSDSGPIRPTSPELINVYLTARIPDYEGQLRQLIERARTVAVSHPLKAIRTGLGDLLMSDARASEGAEIGGVLSVFPTERSTADGAVFLGVKDGQAVTFLGDESLLTIGAPGTGKTQGQVIPTLMTGNHSMVVLDIKGELLRTTRRDLEERGIRVLQFSLIDGHPGAHAYNPMAFLPKESKGLWRKAAQLSELLLPTGPGESGPWLGNARTLLTCHACAVKLERGDAATLKDVMRSIKGGVSFVDGEEMRGTAADRFNAMLDIAEGRGFGDLADEIASLSQLVTGEDGVSGKMWQSILLGVRPLMDLLMSDEVTAATARSDWAPSDLRDRDTRLFVQVRAVDLDAYKPLLRLIIGQHLQSLMEFAGDRPDMPVTFLLDELPQLGDFPEVLRAIEVGRSARVRVWGFVQDLAQIRATYEKAGVLINSPAVTSFLSFDTASAEHLVKLWGTKHDVIRDQRVPAVDVADFFKPDMAGKMVCVARGAQPVVMEVAKAHVLFADRAV